MVWVTCCVPFNEPSKLHGMHNLVLVLTFHPSSQGWGEMPLTLPHLCSHLSMSSVFCILHWSSTRLIPFPMLVFVKMGTSFWLVFVLQRILSFQSCSKCMLSTEGWIWLSQIQLTPFLGKRTRGSWVLLQHTLYNQPAVTTSSTRNSFLLLHCPSSGLGPLSDVIHVWVCAHSVTVVHMHQEALHALMPPHTWASQRCSVCGQGPCSCIATQVIAPRGNVDWGL